MKRILIVLFFSALFPADMFGEAFFTGDTTFFIRSMIDNDNIIQSPLNGELLFKPTIYAGADIVELQATGEMSLAIVDGTIEFELAEITASVYPLSFLSLKIGKFLHSPSMADFFPQLDFFTRRDYEALIAGRIEDFAKPTYLFGINAFYDRFFLKALVEPFRTPVPFFSADSPWLPDLGFPEEISIRFPREDTLTLSEVIIEAYPIAPPTLDDFSVSAEAGGTIEFLDFVVLFYHGLDTAPLYTASLEFPQGLFQDYRVRLTPKVTDIDVLGAGISAVIGSFKLTFENSFAFKKSFLTEKLVYSETAFETLSFESPYYSLTAGVGYENFSINLFINIEYTNGFAIEPDERMVAPSFSHMVATSVLWTFLENRFSLQSTTLINIPDWSVSEIVKASFTTLDEAFETGFSLPLFFGAEDTAFGRYRGNIYPSLYLTVRF